MNEIREIVTRAVVAKGKKGFNLTEIVKPDTPVYNVLGCWIINHTYDAKLDDKKVDLDGSFEINIWHSSDGNTKTNIIKKVITYQKEMFVANITEDYIKNRSDILVRSNQQPTCTDARIVDGVVEVDIFFELITEVIAETKVQVKIQNLPETFVDDFENQIKEEFISNPKIK